MEERNIKLVLAYDGRAYFGWQRQSDQPSIQETLENTLSKLLGESITVHGAGRTDGGAHAMAYSANFHTARMKIPLQKFPMVLNGQLPSDIRVYSAEEVPERFHAAFSCRARHYVYRLWNAPVLPPFLSAYAGHEYHPLELSKLREACTLFVGTHNFRNFAATYPEEKNLVRRVDYFRVKRQGNWLIYYIQGSGFLQGMIRTLVSATIHYARGNMPLELIRGALEGNIELESAFRTRVPACGLYFKRALY